MKSLKHPLIVTPVVLATCLLAASCGTKGGGGETTSNDGVKTGRGISGNTITLGSLTDLTGVFAAVSLGGSGYLVQKSMAAQIGVQALGVLVAIAWCGGLTWVILKLMDVMFGLRVSEEKETEGLDLAEHGERGYSP